jgi:hypothetical protein
MSAYVAPDTPRPGASADYDDYYQERWSGWMAFAGTLLMILGTLNVIQGIAAIGRAHFFVADAHYVFGDIKTWGWVTLCVGVIELLVGLGIFSKNQFARWGGVGILSLGAIASLLMMPAYPFWGLALFALAILALYGLVAHGKRVD